MFKHDWKFHQDTVYWCNLKLARKRGLQFHQIRSHAIVLFDILPSICIENAVYRKTGEEWYSKINESLRAQRIVLKPNPQFQGRHDLPQKDARQSADPQGKGNVSNGETRCGTVEHRIQGIPQSAVRKEDANRNEIVKELIQKFENNFNRASFMEDLRKTEFSNPFCHTSKELMTSMGRVECFELCEVSSNTQCPDFALYWPVGVTYCTCGKCIQPSDRNRQTNKERYGALSILGYVIKKNPNHRARPWRVHDAMDVFQGA